MSENRILNQVVMLMKFVENLEGMGPEQKKQYVIEHTYDILNVSDELKPIISEVIDLLISVDKGRLSFHAKKLTKYKWLC